MPSERVARVAALRRQAHRERHDDGAIDVCGEQDCESKDEEHPAPAGQGAATTGRETAAHQWTLTRDSGSRRCSSRPGARHQKGQRGCATARTHFDEASNCEGIEERLAHESAAQQAGLTKSLQAPAITSAVGATARARPAADAPRAT